VQRGKKYGISKDQVQDLVTLALISGLLGARICHALLYPENYHTWLDFFKIYNGGLVLYGFLFTTPLALIYKARRFKISVHTFFITFSPVLPLGIGIGRLGCFLNGCCYGGPGQQAWCVTFPKDTLPFEAFGAIPLHPSQIYAFLLGLGLALLLKALPTIMPRIHGIQMALSFCFFYGIARLIEEAFRADTPKHFLGLLTAGQGVSVALMLCAVILWVPFRKWQAPS
jgi:phosphatidylglycerol---prolipoprotein diacylglyceryl transferase